MMDRRMHLYLLCIAGVLFVSSYFLFYGGPEYHAGRSTKALWNLGHIAYFAVLVFALSRLRWIRQMTLPVQWLILLLTTLLLGTLIEVLQYGTERSPDLRDIIGDLAGCLLVLAFYPGLLCCRTFFVTRLIRASVAVIVLWQVQPFVIALIDESIARIQFPVLSDFSTPFELDRWKGGAGRVVEAADFAEGRAQLKISLGTEQYSGVGMEYFPSDWSAYQSLNLRLFLPAGDAITITLRIHDLAHELGADPYQHGDRFNRRYTLQPGWNDIAVPLSEVESSLNTRKMDLSRVKDFSFFTVSLQQPRTVYSDSVYLDSVTLQY